MLGGPPGAVKTGWASLPSSVTPSGPEDGGQDDRNGDDHGQPGQWPKMRSERGTRQTKRDGQRHDPPAGPPVDRQGRQQDEGGPQQRRQIPSPGLRQPRPGGGY